MTIDTTLGITVNSETRFVASGTSVDALVCELGLRPEVVAVELNERLVARSERTNTILQDGDRVEVVTLVGGG
jgi:sulfur carrier protein